MNRMERGYWEFMNEYQVDVLNAFTCPNSIVKYVLQKFFFLKVKHLVKVVKMALVPSWSLIHADFAISHEQI